MRTCHLACAKRLPNRSSSPSGALRALASADYTILPERSAWKKNFTYVDTFLLTWQVSRVSDDGNGFRTGGARLGQLIGRAPTILKRFFVSPMLLGSAWSNALAKLQNLVIVIAAACGGPRR